MGLQRFYVAQLPPSGAVELDESESRHASSVLRLKERDEVLAFDGRGGEASCFVTQVGKRSVTLQIEQRLDRNCELSREMHLFVALPKGDRQKSLVDSLVQIGVSSLCPLITHRGVAQPVESALARLSRSVIESSKQCGRNQWMEIRDPVSVTQLADIARTSPQTPPSPLRIFAHPYGQVTPLRQIVDQGVLASEIHVMVGPEGGFTEHEADLLRSAGWTAVTLGPRILRVEVAATHVASWLVEACCSSSLS
jgi:16S rRNA (uracil1498-N3)-methyltransferase